MDIWAIANQKGGVGKTTTAVSLAGILAQKGKSVLLIDSDPHCSATAYLLRDQPDPSPNLFTVFSGDLPPAQYHRCIYKTAIANLDIVPADVGLSTLDRKGINAGQGRVLQTMLNSMSEHYDVAIIDCPPVLGILMVNALAASNQVIVPVQTEYLAIQGLERMVVTLDMLQRSLKRPLPYTILPTMYDQRVNASKLALEQLKQQFSAHLSPTYIPIDTKLRDAYLSGLPISLFSSSSRSVEAYERALLSFEVERAANG